MRSSARHACKACNAGYHPETMHGLARVLIMLRGRVTKRLVVAKGKGRFGCTEEPAVNRQLNSGRETDKT